MSISEEEQKKAVSVVLSKLRQKDLPGLLAAQRSGKLDEFVSPHLDAYIAKNYPNNALSGRSPSTPTTPGNDSPSRELKRTASQSKPRDLKRTASQSKPRDLKRTNSIANNKTHQRQNDNTAESANAMEEGCDVWVRPDRTDNWVKAKIVTIAKYSPPVSAYRKPDLDAMKQSVFVLDLQDDNDSIIGQIEVLSAPMADSLEEYETVKLRNPEGDLFSGDQCAAVNVNDLIALSYLHEPAIMYCLQQRFLMDRIYTSTGPILLAVNPFKNLEIYSEKTVVQYRDAGASAKFNSDTVTKLPPHPFQIADNAYRSMVSNALLNRSLLRSNPYGEVGLVAQNQSILVSGESGAGKTETTKFIMRYLADITKDIKHSADSSSQSIENRVLQSNPILECFGNARTLRNDNSSRFGKFIEINFSFGEKSDEIFRITGATIRSYLLEKVRLVRQAHGERNYHVFYELMKGYDAAQLKALGLTDLSAFNYTNQSSMYERLDGVQDHEQFKKTVQALQVLGIAEQEQAAIWRIIAAVMHVGNITFDVKAGGPGGEDDGSKISPSCQHHVTTCCDLLELNEVDFVKALCVQKLVIPDKVLEKMVSTAGAEHNRDNFSKSMYGALFDWLVQRINNTIASAKIDQTAKNSRNHCFIGVLDIFGFENFQINSFEQLCINFTNETLQHHFNNFVFKHEQNLYEAEGIDWNFIKFPDNSDVLNLLEDRVVGVFAICDEQVRFPKATDITLIHKLYEKCSTHSRFFAGSKEKADNVFIVKHFAGPVKYSSISFLEKNQDVVRPELANVANNSSSALVCELSDFFRIDDALLNKANPLAVRKQSSRNIQPTSKSSSAAGSATNRVSIHNRTKTLGGEFRGQMEELMANINTTSPHYIRCLKPNSNNVGNEFDSPLIVNQLRCGGVLEAVRVGRAGYSKRFTFDVFFRRYCFYVHERCPVAQSHSQASSRELAGKIAQKALHVDSFVPSEDSLGQTDELRLAGIQVGSTSVFFRSHTFDFMERQKLLYHRGQAVKIQSHARKYNAVTNFRQMKRAAKIIQMSTKLFLAKQRAYRLKTFHSIMLLQRVARGYLARCTSGKMMRGFRRLQSVCRAGVERRRTRALRKYTRAATVIQCFVRRRWAIRELRQLKIDAKSVEKVKLVVEELKVKLSESAGVWKAEKVAIIAEFKGEFQDLSASLLVVEKELATANSRNETLTEDLKLTTEDFQELEAEFAEYRESNADKEYAEALEIDLNTVRDDLRQARERADLLEKDNVKLPELKALVDKLQSQVHSLESQEAKQGMQLAAREEELAALTLNYQEASDDLKRAQAAVSEHERRHEKLEEQKETEVSEKVAQLQALEKDLQRSLTQLKESQKQQQQTQGEVANTLQSLHEAVQNNVAELEKFEAEKARKVKGLEDVIAGVTRDLEASQVQATQSAEECKRLEDSSQREIAKLESKLGGLQAALQKAEEESGDLSKKVRSLEGDVEAAQEEADLLRQAISDLESDVSDRNALIESVEGDLFKTNKSLEEAQQEAAQLGEDKRQLQKEVVSKDNELKLKDEVFALREQTLESGSEDLLKDYEKKQRELDAAEAARQDLLVELEKKTADIQKKVEQLQDHEEALDALGKSKESLNEELDNMKADVKTSNKEAKALQKTSDANIAELIVEVKKLEARAQALAAELGSAKQDLGHLQTSGGDQDVVIDSLKRDLSKTNKSLEEAQQEAAQLGEDKRQLQKEVVSKDNELKLKDEVFALREQTLESGSEDLLKDYEKMQREMDAARDELAAMKQEQQGHQQELQDARQEKQKQMQQLQKLQQAQEERQEQQQQKQCEVDAARDELEAMKQQQQELQDALQEKELQQHTNDAPSSEEVALLRAALDEKTAELDERVQQHVALVEALEDQLMALGEELADMKEQEHEQQQQLATSHSLKPKRAASASSALPPRLRAGAGGMGSYSDEQNSDDDEEEEEEEDDDFGNFQEKYVEKRAEVETLHIGLDSLLGEYKDSQNENDELVDILRSRDDMLLESVAVLEDRESALVQIKTLEDGVDNILQELLEVKREKDELQSDLDASLQQQLQRLDEARKTLQDTETKASIEKAMQSERLAGLQLELKEAEAGRNKAQAEAAALARTLQEAERQQQTQVAAAYQTDVSDIKQLVKHLQDSLQAAAEENAKLRVERNDDIEFKDTAGDSIRDANDTLSENIDRDVNKCKHLADWLIDEAHLAPSKALNYSTFLVQDGKSSVKRLRKAVKKDYHYLTNLGIQDEDASSITEALDIEEEGGREGPVLSLFPITLSPSAPRQYTRSANGRLSLSPSVSVSGRPSPTKRPPKMSAQLPQESHEEEKKDSGGALSQQDLRLARLEAQASEAARIAAVAAEEADRVAQLYNRRHSVDSSVHSGSSQLDDQSHRKGKKRELRHEQQEVAKAQEKAYVAASRARDAFFLTTTD